MYGLDHTLEGHEGESHDTSHEKSDRSALHGLGHTAGLKAFTHASHKDQGQQEARTRGKGVDEGVDEAQFIALNHEGNTHHTAVGGDEGQEDTQRGVQGGNGLFEEHFHELHQRRDDEEDRKSVV